MNLSVFSHSGRFVLLGVIMTFQAFYSSMLQFVYIIIIISVTLQIDNHSLKSFTLTFFSSKKYKYIHSFIRPFSFSNLSWSGSWWIQRLSWDHTLELGLEPIPRHYAHLWANLRSHSDYLHGFRQWEKTKTWRKPIQTLGEHAEFHTGNYPRSELTQGPLSCKVAMLPVTRNRTMSMMRSYQLIISS